MVDELGTQGPSTLEDYLRVLWRHKWTIILATIVVPLAAALWASRGSTVYAASAGVLIETANLGANVAGVQDPTQLNPNRVIQTQIPVARLPVVALGTIRATGLKGWSPSDLLGESAVTSSPDSSDILTFSVTDPSASRAIRLANEYARQFTLYRRHLDTSAIASALNAATSRIKTLEAAGRQGSALYASLVLTQQRLSTLEALQTSRAVLVRPASGAAKQGPAVKKDAVFGLALGLLLGIGLAFLLEALDTRVRSGEVVSRELGIAMLGRIARPPRRLRRQNKLVTLAEPFGQRSEEFRMLAPNIEFANLKRRARLILVTSAIEREGKSTTVANLAVAFARGGARVVLVGLDPYSSPFGDFFGFRDRPDLPRSAALTDVVLGESTPSEALREVDVGAVRARHEPSANGHGAVDSRGRLEVMPWGDGPPEAAGTAGGRELASLFEQLKDRADLVLIDSPPLLRTADALRASSHVDALLLVVRVNFIHRTTLQDLRRVLDSCPAPKLGFIATGTDAHTGDAYSGYSHVDRRGRSMPTYVPYASDASPAPIEGQEVERDTGL